MAKKTKKKSAKKTSKRKRSTKKSPSRGSASKRNSAAQQRNSSGNRSTEVGYKKPPKGKPFTPNDPENPEKNDPRINREGGRVSGPSYRLTREIRRKLDELYPNKFGKHKANTMTYGELMAEALLEAAMGGNVMAFREAADRDEGKVVQGVRLEEGSRLDIGAASPLDRLMGKLAGIAERQRTAKDTRKPQ